MAQCHALLAFRKRLVKRGYKDIHIKQARDDAGKVKIDMNILVTTLNKTLSER